MAPGQVASRRPSSQKKRLCSDLRRISQTPLARVAPGQAPDCGWDDGDTASLEGKSVAVIGTGASAIQVVPAIASQVGRLYVYQRTPPWILPKPDRPIEPSVRAIFRRAPIVQRMLSGPAP